MTTTDLTDAPPALVEDAICQLAALRNVALSHLLGLALVYDRSDAWRHDGSADIAAWLCHRLALDRSEARDLVRVAQALESLPALRAKFAEGGLSWAQVREATRFATPGTDAIVAEDAPGRTVASLASFARSAGAGRRTAAHGSATAPDSETGAVESSRRGTNDAAPARDEAGPGSLRLVWDADRRVLRLYGRFAAPDGAIVERAIELLAREHPTGDGTGQPLPWDARAAGALVDLAEQLLTYGSTASGPMADVAVPASSDPSAPASSGPSAPASSGPSAPASSDPSAPASSGPSAPASSGPGSPAPCHPETTPRASERSRRRRRSRPADAVRPLIVVHADASRLVGGDGVAEFEGGPSLVDEELRRLSCDARILLAIEDEGRPVGVGRTRRVVPPWLARLLRRRDGTCRFPGCDRTLRLQAHHQKHWADGGTTDADNTLLLCRFHHWFVHEQGWTIGGSPNGDLTFARPDGTSFATSQPSLRATIGDRFFAPDHPP